MRRWCLSTFNFLAGTQFVLGMRPVMAFPKVEDLRRWFEAGQQFHVRLNRDGVVVDVQQSVVGIWGSLSCVCP